MKKTYKHKKLKYINLNWHEKRKEKRKRNHKLGLPYLLNSAGPTEFGPYVGPFNLCGMAIPADMSPSSELLEWIQIRTPEVEALPFQNRMKKTNLGSS